MITRSVAARWGAVAVFALSSTWNYLDRLVLSAAAPRIRAEFHLSNMDYGWLLSAFSLAYALASPALGWFLDGSASRLALCGRSACGRLPRRFAGGR